MCVVDELHFTANCVRIFSAVELCFVVNLCHTGNSANYTYQFLKETVFPATLTRCHTLFIVAALKHKNVLNIMHQLMHFYIQ